MEQMCASNVASYHTRINKAPIAITTYICKHFSHQEIHEAFLVKNDALEEKSNL